MTAAREFQHKVRAPACATERPAAPSFRHKLVTGQDDAVAAWVSGRLGGRQFKNFTAIGVELDGRIIAGFTYTHFDGISVEMTAAASTPRWCRRSVLAAIFHYPLVQLGARRIQATVAASNARSIRLVTGLGFVPEGRLREALPDGEDALIFGMLRPDCRWLEA